MNFISFAFFALVVCAVIFRLGSARFPMVSQWGLIVVSLVFYAWDVPEYLILLGVAILFNFFLVRQLDTYPVGDINRHFLFCIAIVLNLVTLVACKYFMVIRYILSGVSPYFSQESVFTFLLPIGISFFLLEAMGYASDVYWQRIKPQHSFREFALYICFFPKVVAGPLIPAGDFFAQLAGKFSLKWTDVYSGLYQVLAGVFLKLVIASSLERQVTVYWVPGHLSFDHPLISWMTLWSFYCQIFCDVFGYSLIAIGVARLLGIRLPINFNYPYLATSFRQFWGQWHITLSEWGQRHILGPLRTLNPTQRSYAGIVFGSLVLYGAWHGARSPVLAWGVWHGALLYREIRWEPTLRRFPQWIMNLWGWIFVQASVALGWLLFRSDKWTTVGYHLNNMFSGSFDLTPLKGHIWTYYFLQPMICTLGVIAIHVRVWFARNTRWGIGSYEKAAYAGIMLYLILTAYGKVLPFYYFRFEFGA